MIVKVNVKVGDAAYQFDIEEKDDKDALNKAITLGNPPRECDECHGTEVTLASNKDKEGNVYINVQCENAKCHARAGLGSYKTGGFFWKKFEKYEPKSSSV